MRSNTLWLPAGSVLMVSLACGAPVEQVEVTPPDAQPAAVDVPMAPPAEVLPIITPKSSVELEGSFVEIALGSDGCARAEDGTVTCWRDLGGLSHATGELEAYELEHRYQRVASGMPFKAGGVRMDGTLAGKWKPGWATLEGSFSVAAFGDAFACGLTDAGVIRCLPIEGGYLPDVPEVAGFVALAGSATGGCALDGEGKLACWEDWGDISSDDSFVTVDVGRDAVCAIRASDSALECWGFGDNLPPAGKWRAVSVTEEGAGACAVTEGGQIACWDEDGSRYQAKGEGFADVAVGSLGVCGRRSSGSVSCWPFPQGA